MIITTGAHTRLELIDDRHSQLIFDLAAENRNFLRQWLSWLDDMHTHEFIRDFIKGSRQRNKNGNEFSFVIIENNDLVGRIGIYKIDNQNRIAEIGYWLGQNAQGKGIVTQACQALIDFGFNSLGLNRIEIKCGTANIKSQGVPERLRFKKEGIIRQGEWVQGKFIDLYLYSLLKEDYS